jgi:hypothetical protein
VVHFYNSRDVLPTCPDNFDGVIGETCWPPAENPANINTPEFGDLGLSDAEEDAVVAFLTTLSDGFTDAPPTTGDVDMALDRLSVPRRVRSGQTKKIRVKIENNGDDPASGALSERPSHSSSRPTAAETISIHPSTPVEDVSCP